MLRHITRDFLVIIFLCETEPQDVFVLDGESNEPHIDFPQPISPKNVFSKIQKLSVFNGGIGTKINFFLRDLWW